MNAAAIDELIADVRGRHAIPGRPALLVMLEEARDRAAAGDRAGARRMLTAVGGLTAFDSIAPIAAAARALAEAP